MFSLAAGVLITLWQQMREMRGTGQECVFDWLKMHIIFCFGGDVLHKVGTERNTSSGAHVVVAANKGQ
jgi:hypothetical protein